MNYIVLDLEFNQNYNFNDGNDYKVNPKCRFEIIQIGAVKLDDNFKEIAEFEATIKPQIYKRLHPIVEKITGLRKSQFMDKKTFPQIYDELVSFLDKDSVLCFWGSSDIKALYRNIIFYKLDYTLVQPHFINVQDMATKYLKCPAGTTVGLENAAVYLNLDRTLPFHNALNDARYTSKVLQRMKTWPINVVEFDLEAMRSGSSKKKKANVNKGVGNREKEIDE